MSKYNFDTIIDRTNTNSSKWDGFEERFPGLNTNGALPMWVADMDFKAPEEVVEAIVKKAEFGIYGYPKSQGIDFCNAVSKWIERRHNWKIDNNWIVSTPGIVSAVTYAVQAFTNEGEGVIIQTPVYYPFKNRCINYNNRKVIENPLIFNGASYNIDFDDLEEKASDHKNKLLILSNPHNPVGRVWSEDELKRLIDICIKHNVIIFSDEIHSDLILKGNKHIPAGKVSDEVLDYLVAGYSASKTFNLAGLKASAIVVPNEKLRKLFKNIIAKNEAGGLNIFAETGFVAAYNYGEVYLEELLEYITGNVDYVREYINKNLKGVKLIEPEGTYLIWIDFRDTGLELDEINRVVVEEAKVAGDLGDWFGIEGKGFIRLNIACPRKIVEEAMNRLKKVFGR
ncbi:MalY/PatB family protein [Clostridium diolis]|uniref:cysteine-S-conjugate beta-lyase n=1 Tax=Clostridium diolis TaxID=223919 RepID=A0AAV3W5Z7_9CLOT|nr:MalY/PatB family protein [Clostridium diolis]QES73381.1 pyridoxal phosphate-dependent aminotransferase [Clostridium diolis]GEA33718.1 cystathionine beta-lyase [Clostridium diolis]